MNNKCIKYKLLASWSYFSYNKDYSKSGRSINAAA